MLAHGARFSVYQIMLGHKMWAARKCEVGISRFHMAETPWPNSKSGVAQESNRILILFWIAANQHRQQYLHRNTSWSRRKILS